MNLQHLIASMGEDSSQLLQQALQDPRVQAVAAKQGVDLSDAAQLQTLLSMPLPTRAAQAQAAASPAVPIQVLPSWTLPGPRRSYSQRALDCYRTVAGFTDGLTASE